MSEQFITTQEASPAEAPPERTANEKRYRWFELSTVLLVTVGGGFVNSLYILNNGKGASSGIQDSRWAIAIFQELTGLLLLGYVLSRRRLRFRDLGLRSSFRDLGAGLAVTLASYLTYCVGYFLVHWIHGILFSSTQSGLTPREVFGHPSIMALPLILLNPFFEELIVRAYLMTEIKDLTGSWTLSVAVSVVVQFSYHLYYGWERAIAISFLFLAFAIYYARTQKATPVIVAHGIFDVVAMARLM
jgi:membrane protease YdiL (CAAX protease family)